MAKIFKVDRYEDIRPEDLLSLGKSIIICDLDFTLAPRWQLDPTEDLREWIAKMQAQAIEVVILSNNRSPKRVRRFCSSLGIDYVGHAMKPLSYGFKKVLRARGKVADEAIVLGDRLLTDMLGAKLAGICGFRVRRRTD